MDNGRGIPFEQVETICTYLHSGSNIDKDEEKDNAAEVAGENGVGLTAVNALSKKLLFVIYRDGKEGTFQFVDGKLKKPKYKKCDSSKHGTAVVFIPDENYLGECKINPKHLIEWISLISYTIPTKVKIHFTLLKKNGKKEIIPIYHENGLMDLLNERVTKPMIKPFRIVQEAGRYTDERIHSEAVITIASGDISDATNHISFCNRVITIDDGSHVDALKIAWCRAVLRIANNLMTDNDKKKYNLTYEDCRQGMAFVISANLTEPGFTGQTKQKVDNDEIKNEMIKLMMEDFMKYFKENGLEAKKIVQIVKSTAKNRMSAIKVKRSDYVAYDSFEEAIQKAFVNCSSNKYREIWLMEGNSALGGFKRARDSRFQAGFKLKGNPKNVFGCSLGEILQNAEWREFTKHLGCGIGKDFDINKLKYDKIIIFVDSDIDGWNMTSLICCYFLVCLPELVKAGKIYRAMGPLYITKDNKNPYIVSKSEYYAVFADNVSKNMKLIDVSGHELSKHELKNLITKNRDYLDELMPLVHYYTTNSEIIEFAISHRYDPKFSANLKKKFPELRYKAKSQTIEGTYNNADQYIEINKQFFERAIRLEKIISDINGNNIYYTMIDNGVKYPKQVSLGTFFMKNDKYMPSVIKRIKGIGELNPKILWDSTLNPRNRELIQLTIEDLAKELDTVRILHSADTVARKDFMEGYNFNRDDIDN